MKTDDKIQAFDQYRSDMNALVLSKKNKVINRLFNLDTHAYEAGALNKDTKELLGLVASLVLRCDDCVRYHLKASHESGTTTDQIYEAMSIGSLVGGSIVIPHLRRAAEFWEALVASESEA